MYSFELIVKKATHDETSSQIEFKNERDGGWSTLYLRVPRPNIQPGDIFILSRKET